MATQLDEIISHPSLEGQVLESDAEFKAPAPRVMPPEVWSMFKEQATSLSAATGMLPKGITNKYQIAAIMQAGYELGFKPMYSLMQIALVNGRPLIQTQALARMLVEGQGRGCYRIEESTDDHARVSFWPRGWKTPIGEITWTIEDAKKAGLLGKDNWKGYPRAMLRWRAIAEGARLYFPDVIAGVYTPDESEIPVTVTVSGDIEFDREAMAQLSPPAREPASPETPPAASPPNGSPKTGPPTAEEIERLQQLLGERARFPFEQDGAMLALKPGQHLMRVIRDLKFRHASFDAVKKDGGALRKITDVLAREIAALEPPAHSSPTAEATPESEAEGPAEAWFDDMDVGQ